jgi:DNA-binding transcriptional ArsR family regulator
MDAFAGGNVFGGNSTTIGKVNGKEIDYIDFEKKIKVQEDMYRQQGYDMGDAGRQQVIESVWNAEVMEVVLNEQFNELGLAVSSKEINDILFGNNPPDDLKEFAKALSHPARIAILKVLAQKNECICGDIVEVLPLAQSTVSQHLKELKNAGLIDGSVDGPRSCYCINWKAFEKFNNDINNLFIKLKERNEKACC